MRRDDWLEIKDHITLGGIPGGTGNGLIKSLLANEGEYYGVEEAAWLVMRGQRRFIDLTKLEMEFEAKPVYSFLSVAWSVIADIDLNSEVCRCLGAMRFDLWGAWRVMSLLQCRGTLSLQNAQTIQNRNGLAPESKPLLADQVTFEQHDFTYFYALNMPWAASKMNAAPLSKPNDGVNDIVTSRRQ